MERIRLLVAFSFFLFGTVCALMIVFFPAPYVVGLLGGAALFIMLFWRPELGIYAFILAYPLASVSLGERFFEVSVPNILLLSTLAVLLSNMLLRRHAVKPAGPILKFMIASLPVFVLSCIPSILLADDVRLAMRYLPTRIGYAITFFVIIAFITDAGKIKNALKCLVLSAGIASALTILVGWRPELLPETLRLVSVTPALIEGLPDVRPAALFVSYLPFASWTVLALGICGVFILRPQILEVRRSLYLGIFGLMIAALAYNQTRAGWVAAVFVLFLLCSAPWYLAGKRRASLALLISFCLLSLLLIFATDRRGIGAEEFLVGSDPQRRISTEQRFEQYSIVLDVIRDHPWFGLGASDISVRYLERFQLHPSVHNAFLEELAFSGLVGFLPYIAFLPLSLYCPLKLLWRPSKMEWLTLASAIVIGFSGAFVVYQSYPGTGEKGYWIVLGLCASTNYLFYGEKATKMGALQSVPAEKLPGKMLRQNAPSRGGGAGGSKPAYGC